MESDQLAQGETPRKGPPPAWIAAGVIGLLVLGLLAYALFSSSGESLQEGGPVPIFQLAALDGSTIDLESQRGQVVVVNFFASWCTPCRQEAADLEVSWRSYQDQGVQFYGIAYKDASSAASSFLDEFGITFPSAVDPSNRTARAYGVTGVPETFVIDGAGNLARHFVGPVTKESLGQAIAQALTP